MPRLTEQEQQEVVRYIEADKPLPERYRFLLFGDKREVELVWNGKTSEVTNVILPFQVIEQVDEPRAEKPEETTAQGGLFDARGRQLKGWTNKLIWGDNKLILSSLKNGPLRQEIEKQGGLKLIYIDPPFDMGADFSMDIEIGGDTFVKRPTVLEELAYRDTWGKGADSFIAMIYERLILARDLLAPDGSIFVHCDWRVTQHMRELLDEVFSTEGFRNEIIWHHQVIGTPRTNPSRFAKSHETIYWYSKQPSGFIFNSKDKDVRVPWSEDTFKSMKQDGDGLWYYERRRTGTNNSGAYDPRFLRTYVDDPSLGKTASDVWEDLPSYQPKNIDKTGYSTQKPNELVARIVACCSNPGDLVADFFCGSGTVADVAERLGRKWICGDLGKFAIHTTRKRLINVQRQLRASKQDYRAFEVLNLGKYERQHYVGVNPNLREAEQAAQLAQKESDFLELILRAYRAEKTDGFATFHGKKGGRLVSVGPVNLPVTRLYVEEVIAECRQKRITRVDILGFEFEMGLFPNVLDEARAKGIDIAPKYIPAEVFDKRAVEKDQVRFYDVSFIEVKPHVTKTKDGKHTVAVELTDFSVFYSQDSIAEAERTLKDKGSKVVVEKGQIVKIAKDKNGVVTREVLTRKWSDWIDYWAVDFNYESKREIIRKPIAPEEQVSIAGMEPDQLGLEAYEEVWTGDYIFENEWQEFRTKKDRSLGLTSVAHECPPGRRKIAVKVVDIFGNDTMTICAVNVGGGK